MEGKPHVTLEPNCSYTETSESTTPNDSNSQNFLSVLSKSLRLGLQSILKTCVMRPAEDCSSQLNDTGPDKIQSSLVLTATGSLSPLTISPANSSLIQSGHLALSLLKSQLVPVISNAHSSFDRTLMVLLRPDYKLVEQTIVSKLN